jgi:hypothetical protein
MLLAGRGKQLAQSCIGGGIVGGNIPDLIYSGLIEPAGIIDHSGRRRPALVAVVDEGAQKHASWSGDEKQDGGHQT